MINMSDIAIMYAAARVAFNYVFESYQEYKDPALNNAMKEILSIETVLEKYLEKPNEVEDKNENSSSS